MQKINGNLSLNLQEMHVALSSGTGRPLNLISNLSGTRLYHTGYGWGRFWRILFAVWGFFFGSSLKQRKLYRALTKTAYTLKNTFRIIHESYHTFKRHLSNAIEDLPEQSSDGYAKARWIITHWNDAVKPFVNLLQRGDNKKLEELQLLLHRNRNDKAPPFHFNPSYAKIARCQHLIDLERILDMRTPYFPLYKLATKKRIGKDEEADLHAWAQKLIAFKDRLPVNKLHKGLKYFVDYIERKHCGPRQPKPNLFWLEVMLILRGCPIFRQNDPKFIARRNTLKPGDSVDCGGQSYVLKEQLSTRKQSADNNRIFSVEGRDDIVLHFGKNRAILGVKQVISKKSAWGIRTAQVKAIDESGSCAVIEKLHQRLDMLAWSNENPLTKQDLSQTLPIINQIKWFVKRQLSPRTLNARQLMLDSHGTIKNTKISLPGPFDYAKLVRFALDCSGENNLVFKTIMKESGLSSHTYADYYHEIAKHSLKGVDLSPEDLASMQRYQIDNPLAVERAEELRKELSALSRDITQNLLKKYIVDDPALFSRDLRKTIYSHYKNSGAICLLWPALKKTISHSLVEKHRLPRRN